MLACLPVFFLKLLDYVAIYGLVLMPIGAVVFAEHWVFPLLGIEQYQEEKNGWAEMIRKVYEVEPMVCPQCGGKMKVIAFLTNYSVVDRIIDHLKLTFAAERPPPPQLAFQEHLMAAETSAEYSS